MRKRNWSEYNKHLVQQGSISFFIDPKIFKNMKNPKQLKKRGRPQEFSDRLIRVLFILKIRFRLPYRALEGFAKSLLENWLIKYQERLRKFLQMERMTRKAVEI